MAKKTKIKFPKLFVTFLSLIALATNFYLIHTIYLLNGIENKGRYLFIALLITFDALIITEWLKFIKKKVKNKKHTIFYTLLVLYIIVNMAIGFAINRLYSTIDSVNKDYTTYSTSLVTLSTSGITNIDDLNNKKVGIVSDTESIDGYIISKEIIDKNNLTLDLVEYDSFTALLNALYNKEIEAIFVTSNYSSMYITIDKFANIDSETKVLTTQTKKVKKEEITSTKSLAEPFSILLMGVDSEVDGLDNTAASNGDSLIVVTFNPNTSNITMVSIPRDSYVPIACFTNQIENKITHAAWQGTSCMINTIQNYFDIPIDYYVKINFKGVVGLVDALGGIEVNVPQALCTNDSSRESEVCISAGLQTLNGEQALVLARNRHDLANGDLDREQNQQLIIESILNKLKDINSIDQITSVLNTISNNIDTNFTTNQILSFYNIAKDMLVTHNNEINIQSLLLQGNGQMIYDENMNLVLWDYILNEDSVTAVTNAMKNNLNITQDYIKTFTYSIDYPYEYVAVGSEYTAYTYFPTLPNFTVYSQSYANSWLSKNGFNYDYVEKDSSKPVGTIIDQSIVALKRLDKISNRSITLYISNGSLATTSDTTDDETTNDESNDTTE
ncbi:MAG: LCP family protein [Bacilli bacterium]|nr:LCP family protein [Bacilli bacterium]